jgi:hypothetical protein
MGLRPRPALIVSARFFAQSNDYYCSMRPGREGAISAGGRYEMGLAIIVAKVEEGC